MAGKRNSKLQYLMTSCKHLILGVEQTELHGDFLRMYEDAREFGKLTKLMIDRTKGFVQPVPGWKQAIFQPSDHYTSMELFGELLKETADAFKTNTPKIAEFYKATGKAMLEMEKVNKEFQLHVKTHTLKPMEKFLEDDLEKIKNEFDNMIRLKKSFDDARNKLKTCKQEKIEDTFKESDGVKTSFEKQAVLVTGLLEKMPKHIDTQRIAMRQLALGYNQLNEKSKNITTKMLQDTLKTAEP